MIQSLWSASSGMLAQQLSLDNVANNMANVNTPGFKKSRVDFQDLLYSQTRTPDRMTRTGQVVANGLQVGSGTRPSATQMIFEQGSIQQTGNPMDIAISGNAFFEVMLPDGTKAYTRDGSFSVDSAGNLVNGGGYRPNVEAVDGGVLTFTNESPNVNINNKGIVFRDKQILQINAYTFSEPGELQEIEPGVFKSTGESGQPTLVSKAEGNKDDGAAEPEVFYRVVLPGGETAYTREKYFEVNADGRLVTADKGYPLEPVVSVDIRAEGGSIKQGSVVIADNRGGINSPVEAGRLNVVRFTNPAGLEKIGSNLYLQTANSGAPQAAEDYELISGSLEMSNVQAAEEMVAMMIAQRAYEINSRAVRTSDEMLGMANSLLRR